MVLHTIPIVIWVFGIEYFDLEQLLTFPTLREDLLEVNYENIKTLPMKQNHFNPLCYVNMCVW